MSNTVRDVINDSNGQLWAIRWGFVLDYKTDKFKNMIKRHMKAIL